MYVISVTFVLLFTRIKHDFVVSNLLLLLSRRRFWVKTGKATLLWLIEVTWHPFMRLYDFWGVLKTLRTERIQELSLRTQRPRNPSISEISEALGTPKKLKTKRFSVLNQDIVDPRNSENLGTHLKIEEPYDLVSRPRLHLRIWRSTPRKSLSRCVISDQQLRKRFEKILKIRHWTCRSRPQWLFESQATLKRFWSEPRRRRLFQVVDWGLLFYVNFSDGKCWWVILKIMSDNITDSHVWSQTSTSSCCIICCKSWGFVQLPFLWFLWYPHWPPFLWYLSFVQFFPSSSFLCQFDFFIHSFCSLILFDLIDVFWSSSVRIIKSNRQNSFFSTVVKINKQSRGSVKRPLWRMSRRRRKRKSWRRGQEKKTSPKTQPKTTTTTTTAMWRKRLTENLPREKCPSRSIYKEPEM